MTSLRGFSLVDGSNKVISGRQVIIQGLREVGHFQDALDKGRYILEDSALQIGKQYHFRHTDKIDPTDLKEIESIYSSLLQRNSDHLSTTGKQAQLQYSEQKLRLGRNFTRNLLQKKGQSKPRKKSQVFSKS